MLSSDTYPSIEVDLICKDFTIEVKFNGKFYSGISQILMQKTLYGIKFNILLHFNAYIDKKFMNGFTYIVKRFPSKIYHIDIKCIELEFLKSRIFIFWLFYEEIYFISYKSHIFLENFEFSCN